LNGRHEVQEKRGRKLDQQTTNIWEKRLRLQREREVLQVTETKIQNDKEKVETAKREFLEEAQKWYSEKQGMVKLEEVVGELKAIAGAFQSQTTKKRRHKAKRLSSLALTPEATAAKRSKHRHADCRGPSFRESVEDPFHEPGYCDVSQSEFLRQPSEQPLHGPPSWSLSQRPFAISPTLTDRQHDYAAIGEEGSQDSKDMELAGDDGVRNDREKPGNGHGGEEVEESGAYEEVEEVEESGGGEEGEGGQEDEKSEEDGVDGEGEEGGVNGEGEEGEEGGVDEGGEEGEEGGVDGEGEGEERSAAAEPVRHANADQRRSQSLMRHSHRIITTYQRRPVVQQNSVNLPPDLQAIYDKVALPDHWTQHQDTRFKERLISTEESAKKERQRPGTCIDTLASAPALGKRFQGNSCWQRCITRQGIKKQNADARKACGICRQEGIDCIYFEFVDDIVAEHRVWKNGNPTNQCKEDVEEVKGKRWRLVCRST